MVFKLIKRYLINILIYFKLEKKKKLKKKSSFCHSIKNEIKNSTFYINYNQVY